MLTPGAPSVGASRSKLLGPRELNQLTLSASPALRASVVEAPSRTLTGLVVPVARACNASPSTCVTLIAGIVVFCTSDRNTGGPGCRSNRTAARAPALAALVILVATTQVPVGISAIAPAKDPAGKALQPVALPTSPE